MIKIDKFVKITGARRLNKSCVNMVYGNPMRSNCQLTLKLFKAWCINVKWKCLKEQCLQKPKLQTYCKITNFDEPQTYMNHES